MRVVFLALLKAGQVREAQELLSRIDDTEVKSEALSLLGEVATRANQINVAEQIWREAQRLARLDDNPEALTVLAVSLARSGYPKQARETIEEIQPPLARLHALLAAAKELQAQDKAQAAEPFWTKARGEALSLHANNSDFDLVYAAEILTDAGKLTDAEAVCNHVGSDALRAIGLSFVSSALAASGKVQEAHKLVDNFSRDENRSVVLSGVAKGLAKLHRYREARSVANECGIAADKLSAYSVILLEYEKQQNSQLRLSLETTPVLHR